jgi:hypothetical protein
MSEESRRDWPKILKDFPRASTVNLGITIKDGTTPRDVTGYKGYVAYSRDPDGVPEHEVELVPTATPADGQLLGTLTDSDSLSEFEVATYYYSIKYVKPAGDAYTIDMAEIDVLQEVSARVDQT